MAKVVGLGGVFFRATDPEALGAWYQTWLGLPVEAPYGASFNPADLPGEAFQAWAPFSKDTTYFGKSDQTWMVNFIVDDLEGVLERVQAGGGDQVGDIVEEPYGRFAWFVDPEGNRVELWEPVKARKSDSSA